MPMGLINGAMRLFERGTDPWSPTNIPVANIPLSVSNGGPRIYGNGAIQSNSGYDPRAVIYNNGGRGRR